MNWACDPLLTLQLLPHTTKKEAIEMNFHVDTTLDLKRGKINDKTLRFTVYDRRRKHQHIPIGHSIVPLRNVNNIEKVNVHTKNISIHSQPAGFNRGSVLISTNWSPTAQKLEIKVGKVSNLKKDGDDTGKEYYIKIVTYIGSVKHKSFKTQQIKAGPELIFHEKFVVCMNATELKDSSTVFLLYVKGANKMRGVKTLCGRTLLGPYMRKSDERGLSHWEKNITNPLEEIVENHELYL